MRDREYVFVCVCERVREKVENRQTYLIHIFDRLAVEWRRPRQQHVAEHAQRPHVTAVVIVAVQHLGRCPEILNE